MNQSLISSLKGRDQLSITMVCLGNICRSPMAAAVLAGKTVDWKVPRIEVHSSGTGPWHIGQGPHPSSKKIWEAAGYKHSHTAKQFKVNDFFVHDLILVMDSDKAVGEVFNVGNNQQISIMGLANKVIEITDSKSTIEKIAYEQAYPQGFEDMQRRVPDISKIKQVLGWSPEINLDQIIKDIAAFNTK